MGLDLRHRLQLGANGIIVTLGKHRSHDILLGCGQLILQCREVGLRSRDGIVKLRGLIRRQWAAKTAAPAAAKPTTATRFCGDRRTWEKVTSMPARGRRMPFKILSGRDAVPL